jgi:hypothetical protein
LTASQIAMNCRCSLAANGRGKSSVAILRRASASLAASSPLAGDGTKSGMHCLSPRGKFEGTIPAAYKAYRSAGQLTDQSPGVIADVVYQG